MRWSRRIPKKDGWYWVRYPNGKIDIAEAEYCDSDIKEDKGMWVCPAGTMADLIEYHEDDIKDWWFAGPIPEPEPPEFPGEKN